jgi:hypothetical protein
MACNDDGCACLITSLPSSARGLGTARPRKPRTSLCRGSLTLARAPSNVFAEDWWYLRPRTRLHHLTMSIRRCHHECDTGWRSGEAWLRKRGRTASILGVDEDTHNEERQSFAYWSGYTPGKRNPDGTLTPLNRDELRAEAARFRRGALRARERGDAAQAARLEVTANDLEHRGDQATED